MRPPSHQIYPLGIRMQVARSLPLLLLASLLLAGCRNAQQPSPTDGPQILTTLPQGWTPVTLGTNSLFNRDATNWTPINIDNDLTTEYLLFFTYDNGQMGAIIYDQQTGSTGVVNATPVPAPNQPTGVYIPYQVEPSYWTRSDTPDRVGYVAAPGTDPLSLRVEQVERLPAGDVYPAGTANPDPGSDVPATNEANIYGGNTVLSVIWWRNAYNGYGVAQVAAPGGLLVEPQSTGDVPRPIQTVVGQTPLSGLLARSVLCRAVRYTREDAGEPADIIEPVYQSAVRYAESDNGIVFCLGTPAYPYYPEGVVLAYLQPPAAPEAEQGEQPVDPSQQYLWSELNEAQRATINAMVDLDGTSTEGSPDIVVRELRAPASVSLAPDVRAASGPPITTNVCTEIVSEDGTQFRRLLFDLLYEPVQEVGATIVSERFVITAVTDITDVVLNCPLVIP